MNPVKFPFISIVVIGFNEETNLNASMQSILNSNYPRDKIELIYVDSGSKDNSVVIAKKYTSNIFIEKHPFPTAARNRNRGLIESKYDIVHFIDSDIIINKDYLKFAVEKLLDGDVHGVFGRLEERNVNKIGKILLYVYGNFKPGYVDAPGAGGTFSKKVLIEVNGWDERIPRGEESELGERLRKAGFKIWYLDKYMGSHDFGINNIFGFLKKQIGEGLSSGAISLINSDGAFFKNTKRIIFSNFLQHLVLLIILLVAFQSSCWVIIILSIILYNLLIFLKYYFIKRVRNINSLRHFFLMNITRSFVLYGNCKFYLKFLFVTKNNKSVFYNRISIKNLIVQQQQNTVQ